MSEGFAPSQEFADLFFLAIDHGFESIEDGAGPLIPFVLTQSFAGERDLHRFVTEELSDGVMRAQAYVEENRTSIRMYAIASDAYITIDGKKWDAILVEAGDSSSPVGAVFAQRYQAGKKGFFRKAKNERVGNPALISHPVSRLSPSGAP
ncbi:MAG: hypothetical protein KDA83_17955 [Planctomycetales bacterium]|nr:hypothetical protein [Planctomycetales bacterium]